MTKQGSSRLDQILRGMAVPPQRAATGINDRRCNPRHHPVVGMGQAMIGSSPAITKNVSAGGLAVIADVDLGLGDNVPVKFAGLPVRGARIVWKRGALVGLALPIPMGRP
jgi:hypothetical protein